VSKYVGTYVNRGEQPMNVVAIRGRTHERAVYAVRKRSLAGRWIGFLRACRLWDRVQRLGSRA